MKELNIKEEIKPKPKSTSACPDCGKKLIEKWSGVKCSACDYWFCY